MIGFMSRSSKSSWKTPQLQH